MTGDYDKMMSVKPDEVVFNGVAFQYNDHPLTAKVGQRVRLYVIDAGPISRAHSTSSAECSLPFTRMVTRNTRSAESHISDSAGPGRDIRRDHSAPGK